MICQTACCTPRHSAVAVPVLSCQIKQPRGSCIDSTRVCPERTSCSGQKATSISSSKSYSHVFGRCLVCRAECSSVGEVVSWAKQQFFQEVYKPDNSINLAKACLLIALGEEAAFQLDATEHDGRTLASASTWSLSRLDALADEVRHTLATQQADKISSSSDSHGSSSGSNAADGSVSNGMAATADVAEFVRAQVRQFPMQVLCAVNAVLFDRHGYTACNRYGASNDSQLAAVMENGPGSCAALTVLYVEVCRRISLQLGFTVLEEGRYCLVWPALPEQQQLLTAAGEPCVVDVYGKGALLTAREVSELFGITQADLFAGSSRRDLLAALLADLLHSHWCSAVGCSPQPGVATPLTASTALQQHVIQLDGFSIQRAVDAAEKRVELLPGDLSVRLQLALLSYFSGQYDDAWLELGIFIEGMKRAEQSSISCGHDTAAAVGATNDSAVGAAAPALGPKELSRVAAGAVVGATMHRQVMQSGSGAAGGTAADNAAEGPQGAGVPAAAAMQGEAAGNGSQQTPSLSTAEWNDILLLFEKLQLELLVTSSAAA